MRMRRLSLACSIVFAVGGVHLAAQDGAGYNAAASAYKAPAASLAGSTDTPERLAALAPLWQGNVDEALPKLKQLAENGDIPIALLLGGLYRAQSQLPLPADPATALHFFTLASLHGSGEASELIAEMVEQKQVPETMAKGDAEFWRNKARQQGWKQQRLSAYCFDWTHGPEPLHCEKLFTSAGVANMPPEIEPQCPTDAEMESLRTLGMTGMIRQNGGTTNLVPGPRARALVILDHPAPSEADLKEPDAASVIYIQTATNRWRMVPPDAPLLDRFLILTPNRPDKMERMMLAAQAVDGSRSGGACSKFTLPSRSQP
jgi:hypothetical protein